jgi:hypothetical protein
MPNLAPAERPTKQYKRRFFEEVMATAPGSTWSKMIDRRTGIVNNEFPSAADLLPCLPNPDGFLIEYSYHLILQPVQLGTVRVLGEAQLARVGHDPNLRDQLEAILDEARRVGFSDDGALSMAIRKRPSVGSHAIERSKPLP